MKPSRLLLIAGLLLAPAVHAEDIPLRNWSVPETLGRQLDLTDGVPFVGIQPCRVVDTRPSQGFPAAWGPPILVANATRNFDINSAPHCTAIPANARAYSLNFTITEPVGPGDVRAWPAGNPAVVSIQNWGAANVTIANAAIVTAGTNGEITVQIGGSNSHLIIDINGYFSDTLNSPKFFGVTGTRSGGGVVVGQNTSTSNESSGVRGLAGATFSITTPNVHAGVRGESATGVGVLGLSQATGAAGTLVNTSGGLLAAGYLGYAAGSNAAVYANGDIGATGMKFFVEPHPTDASKVIRYVALEGPEPGTYFRGSARTSRGFARIPVPESFRIVTADDGLTAHLTPVGDLVVLAVMSKDLQEIVVRSARDVSFDYEVRGRRRSVPEFEPIAEGRDFIPSSPESILPGFLSDEAKRRLVSNGTYNPDGSVNLTTAERLGWTTAWRTKSPPDSAKEP